MTIQYEGCGKYNLYAGYETFLNMDEKEMVAIANYVHENHFEGCISSELRKANEMLKEEIDELKGEISDWEFEYRKIYDDMAEVLKDD